MTENFKKLEAKMSPERIARTIAMRETYSPQIELSELREKRKRTRTQLAAV